MSDSELVGGRNIVVVDDDPDVRDSTAVLLGLAGHQVTVFDSGSALIEAGVPPGTDIILLDLMMPGLSGLETLRALSGPGSPAVVMLSGHGDIPLAVEAMRAGALDFVEKPYPTDKLLQLVGEIELKRAGCPDAAKAAATEKIAGLSPRQREILRAIASGEPSKVTAHALGLSVRTVETYRRAVFTRLGVRRLADAVRLAVLAGLAGD
jgi:two-component system response regulator FixJ